MSQFKWIVAPAPPAEATWPADIVPLVGRILWQRGFRTESAQQHLMQPQYGDLLRPGLYLGMEQAVGRLQRALARRESITVYGDYDADGICATAIVVETLQALGGKVDWYLPSRTGEGYGLHADAIEVLAKQGTKLLVTVDCGTTNIGEIAQAYSLGLEVIVLDHHQAPTRLPAAVAIINPHVPGQTYPFIGHASGGVAFTVMRGLLEATEYGSQVGHPLHPGWEKRLLDLAAIATVADLMPVTGENRLLVHFGLLILQRTKRPGLKAMAHRMATDLQQADATTISYRIGPRLNAAGRLQHASGALRLLLTLDTAEASQLAAELEALNTERQRLTELAAAEAWQQIQAQGSQAGYTAFAEDWSPGVIGLVAGRMVERVWRPVIVMTRNGDDIVGSGRSVPGLDITAQLHQGARFFQRFGGHAGACGFTLANPAELGAVADWWRLSLPRAEDQPVRELAVDTEIRLAELTPNCLDQLQALGPFGVDHPRPRLLLRGVSVVGSGTVGNGSKHLRLLGRQGGVGLKFIGFRQGQRLSECPIGSQLDIVIEAGWNEWNGRRSIEGTIIDFRTSP